MDGWIWRVLSCVLGMTVSCILHASSTHVQHIIKNKTPFEFYYAVNPTNEVPSAFSCQCSGFISPGEVQTCNCYSQIEAAYRRYRIEYMKNTSPTTKASVTYGAESEVAIIWELVFDAYWEWLGVRTNHVPI